MKLKKVYPYLLLLALPFLQGTQCNKDVDQRYVENEHVFNETVTLAPYRLDYAVGDTLWLRVNIPGKKLLDEKTGTRILFDSSLFKSMAGVRLLYHDPFIGDGPFVAYIFPPGVSAVTSNGNYQTLASVDFGCTPSPDYSLLLGMVLLKPGAMGISFNNNSIQQCGTNNYKNSKLVFTFDVPDTHQEFYQQLPFSTLGIKPDDYSLNALQQKWLVAINVQ